MPSQMTVHRSPAQRRRLGRIVLTIGLAVASCRGNQIAEERGGIPDRELAYRERFDGTPIVLRGSVEDVEHQPLEGARISIADQQTTTDARGMYEFRGLSRRFRLITIDASGYRLERLPVQLHQPLTIQALNLDPVLITIPRVGEARVLFAGDASLGRRFMTPSGDIPFDRLPEANPDAIIPSDQAGPAASRVVSEMVPIFELADYRSLNLETVVTDTPDTPYQGKSYVFYTLPESLQALDTLGIGFVSLGNNHMYDYLEQGVSDTIRHVASRGIGLAGAGLTPAQAFEPYRVSIGGLPYSMVSATSVTGDQYDTLFVVSDEQGGAASAWNTELFAETIASEVATGRYPIVHLHAGAEYTELPVESSHQLMQLSVESGASMVVAHHPHVPEGFEWYGDRLIAHSLGNFVFDQDRLETMLTQVLRADISGNSVENGRSIPTYIENFRPRPFGGDLANIHLRQIASVSTPYGALVFPYLSQGWVVRPGEAQVIEEKIEVSVEIDDTGFAIVDLRGLADSQGSLSSIEVDSLGVVARVGRDILRFGDMENIGLDEDSVEYSPWYYTNSASFPCVHEVYRGATALCLCRSWDSGGDAVISIRNRVRVRGHAENQPQKDLTLLAYTQGENAGPVSIEIRYYASEGSMEFGSETIWDGKRGSWDWTPLAADLNMPADDPESPTSRTRNPRALRIFVRLGSPKRGEGYFRIDDVAFLSWEESVAVDGSEVLSVPHSRDFIRFEGPPGPLVAHLGMKVLRPL